jgi:hypothetical protein
MFGKSKEKLIGRSDEIIDMSDTEYLKTPAWFTKLYPENLGSEYCAKYMRVPKYHMGRDKNGRLDFHSKGNPYSVAEQYSYLAKKLAKLWYGSFTKDGYIKNKAEYKDKSDSYWVDIHADEYFGAMPSKVHQKLNSYINMQKHELEPVVPEAERLSWEKICDHYHKWAETTIETIIEFINRHPVETIHYVGSVDDGITRAIRKNDHYKLTIMDMSNKFESGHGYHFDNDLNLVDFDRPPWLERIPFYSEGGPFIPDLWIRDCRWDWEKQLDDILTWSMPRRPTYVILLGDAIVHGLHEFYSWREEQDIYFGELKEEHVLGYTDDQRDNLIRRDAHMRGEREEA